MFTCRHSNLKSDLRYNTINYYVLESENIQTFVFFLPKLNIIRLNRPLQGNLFMPKQTFCNFR